jgi:hypothetical protein
MQDVESPKQYFSSKVHRIDFTTGYARRLGKLLRVAKVMAKVGDTPRFEVVAKRQTGKAIS